MNFEVRHHQTIVYTCQQLLYSCFTLQKQYYEININGYAILYSSIHLNSLTITFIFIKTNSSAVTISIYMRRVCIRVKQPNSKDYAIF